MNAAVSHLLQHHQLRRGKIIVRTASALHHAAGALDGIARGQDLRDTAFTVAYLKRALDHLHKSQSGLEAAAQKKLLPEAMMTQARKELLEIREGILRLMDEFRQGH